MSADLIQLYANANIRIAELERENAALRAERIVDSTITAIEGILADYKFNNNDKVLAIYYVLEMSKRKTQP